MESTIDRKEYRRNSYSVCERNNGTPKKKESMILNQIINSLLLFLAVLLLELFGFEKEFEIIKNEFSKGLTYEVLSENLMVKAKEIYSKIDLNKNESGENIIVTNFESGEIIEEKNYESGEIIEEKNIKSGEELKSEMQEEGVNQLIDDVNNIKSSYEIISPLKGIITSKFGARVSDNPIVSSYHTGLDIGANSGTIISAAHDGKIIQAGENGTYGKSVIIESGDLKTVYAHCSTVLVKAGLYVKKGEQIAKVGMTGNATGPHLHFEIRYKERFVNPEDII